MENVEFYIGSKVLLNYLNDLMDSYILMSKLNSKKSDIRKHKNSIYTDDAMLFNLSEYNKKYSKISINNKIIGLLSYINKMKKDICYIYINDLNDFFTIYNYISDEKIVVNYFDFDVSELNNYENINLKKIDIE